MVKLNHHYQKLTPSYLFSEVERRLKVAKEKAPQSLFINLGIGDVTHPLLPAVVSALQEAVQELGKEKSFRGYGPTQGYPFLREAIATHDYKGLSISFEEIFISNGAKCDIASLQKLFDADNRVALPTPTYPVYLDTSIMSGRTRPQLKTGNYGGVIYLACTEENGFQPQPPSAHADLIFLCSPNNPVGVAMERSLLKKWVAYAKEHEALIFFDGAYEAYIQSKDVPRSIYEIEGSKEVAVEIRSFSKTAGFTDLRCSYTVVPKELLVRDAGAVRSLHALWQRHRDTTFNGVPYAIQKAALALYTSEGKKQVRSIVQRYRTSAQELREGILGLGGALYGGVDAPYLWWKTPENLSSWDFFDRLLEKAHLITTPGSGFGKRGEGFMRLSAFADPSSLQEALLRLRSVL